MLTYKEVSSTIKDIDIIVNFLSQVLGYDKILHSTKEIKKNEFFPQFIQVFSGEEH